MTNDDNLDNLDDLDDNLDAPPPPHESDIMIGRYRLVCTCGACPEQYDVVDEMSNAIVGYLRLRHGHFTAEYPHCGGELVYEASTRGDGMFEDDERMSELFAAVAAISRAYTKPPGV